MTLETVLQRVKDTPVTRRTLHTPEKGYKNDPQKQTCNLRNPRNRPEEDYSKAKRQDMIHDAETAASLPSATLTALLSTEDHEDLASGRMTEKELRCFASSISARWASGALLPDEKRWFPRKAITPAGVSSRNHQGAI